MFSVNLYRGRGKSFIDRFLSWALTFGRLIVILTEIVALLTFLYRFSLDRELIDLHDRIKQKQAIVKFLKNNEEKYRNLQERLAMTSSLGDQAKEKSQILDEVVNLAPKDLVLNNLVITEDSLRLEASVFSASSLGEFVKNLKNHPKIKSLSLDKIENRTSSGTIVISLRAVLEKSIF